MSDLLISKLPQYSASASFLPELVYSLSKFQSAKKRYETLQLPQVNLSKAGFHIKKGRLAHRGARLMYYLRQKGSKSGHRAAAHCVWVHRQRFVLLLFFFCLFLFPQVSTTFLQAATLWCIYGKSSSRQRRSHASSGRAISFLCAYVLLHLSSRRIPSLECKAEAG